MERIKVFLDQYRYQIIVSLGIGLFLMVIGMIILFFHSNNQHISSNGVDLQSNSSHILASENSSIMESSSSSNPQVKLDNSKNYGYVDLKGAVKRPGIYQINSEMRVDELIKMAGGLKSNAELKNINLAQKLVDQQVIYISKRGESSENAVINSNANASDNNNVSSPNGQVNINTADATQMQQINGVGAKRAEQIIAYREEHGPFKQIEDIKNVSGFGDKMFENMKESISV